MQAHERVILEERVGSGAVGRRRIHETERIRRAREEAEEEELDDADDPEDERGRAQAVRESAADRGQGFPGRPQRPELAAAGEGEERPIAGEDPAPEEDRSLEAAPERDRRVVGRRLAASHARHVFDAEVVREEGDLHHEHAARHGEEGEVGGAAGQGAGYLPAGAGKAGPAAGRGGQYGGQQPRDDGRVAECAQHAAALPGFMCPYESSRRDL